MFSTLLSRLHVAFEASAIHARCVTMPGPPMQWTASQMPHERLIKCMTRKHPNFVQSARIETLNERITTECKKRMLMILSCRNVTTKPKVQRSVRQLRVAVIARRPIAGSLRDTTAGTNTRAHALFLTGATAASGTRSAAAAPVSQHQDPASYAATTGEPACERAVSVRCQQSGRRARAGQL
jgi:hypothetical protein